MPFQWSIKPRLVVAWGLLAVALGMGAAAWWLGRPARHLAEARRLIDAGEPASVVSWLKVPEASAGTRDEALLLRARVAVERNRPAEAVAPLNRINPNGRWAADADYWKARALYAAGNTRLAIAWLKRVLERRPDDKDALRWLAVAVYDLGDWPTAVATLETVIRLQPGDAGAWRTLGVLYKEEEQFDNARRAYEATLKYAPSQPQARLELAECLINLGRCADAERQLALLREGAPEADHLKLLGRCLRARGDKAALRVLLDDGLETYPNHPDLLAQRAELALTEGRAADAVRDLDRAVAAAPHNRQHAYQHALALLQLGRQPEGRREMERANELNALALKLSQLARRAAERPDDAKLRCQLAGLSRDLGDTRQAAYWYRAALACDPNHEPARAGLNALGTR